MSLVGFLLLIRENTKYQELIKVFEKIKSEYNVPYEKISYINETVSVETKKISNLRQEVMQYVCLNYNVLVDFDDTILDNPNVSYVRARWDSVKGITLQYSRQYTIKELQGFMAAVFSGCTSRTYIIKHGITDWGFKYNDSGVSIPFKIVPSKLLRVMPHGHWCSSDQLISLFSKLVTSKLIHFTKDRPDYHLVINATNEQVPPNRTLWFCMEPKGEQLFGGWLNMNPGLFFKGLHSHSLNFAEWHLKGTSEEISELVKEKVDVLSVCVSAKNYDPGHKYRLALIKMLDERGDVPIHIYGQCASIGFKNYKGELESHNKLDSLLNYKYHLNVENHYIDNYITEKFWDPMLCECFIFYKGAPNVHKYFSGDNYLVLDDDLEKAYSQIVSKMKDPVDSVQDFKKIAKFYTNLWNAESRIWYTIKIIQANMLMMLQSREDLESDIVKKNVNLLVNQNIKNVTFIQFNNTSMDSLFEICGSIVQKGLQTIVMKECVKSNSKLDYFVQNLYILLASNPECELLSFSTTQSESEWWMESLWISFEAAEKLIFNRINNLPVLTGIKCKLQNIFSNNF